MADPLIRGALLAAAWLAAAIASAETLPDPTRPPTAGLPPGAAVDLPSGGGLQLQSVLIRPGARPQAMINGEWIEQGRKFGDFRVVKITAEAAILRGPNGKETLALTPAASKQPVRQTGKNK